MSKDQFTKEEIDRIVRWEFEGLGDAASLMLKRQNKKKIVGRWDWHLWMFIVSTCLPCFGLYCFAMWARKGLWEEYRKMEADKKPAEDAVANDQVTLLQKEIQRLKMMLYLRSGRNPPFNAESVFPKPPPKKEEKKPEPKQKSFSERMWSKITPWLPFYVEPFYQPGKKPPKTDFSPLMKPDDSK